MKRVICLSAVLLSAVAGTVLAPIGWQLYHPDTISVRVTPPPFPKVREVYPFSVIPGGVYDSQELSESIQRDPVARQHYRGIDPARMRSQRLHAPVLAYVSFRQGDSIRWTSKKVTVARGEVVLTDGANLVRARCGNRMTVKGPKPADEIAVNAGGAPRLSIPEPLAEAPVSVPPEFVFETPVPTLGPPSIAATPPSALVPSTTDTPLMSLDSVRPGDTPYSYTDVSPRTQPKPTPTPEPATLTLLASGVAATILAGRWRRRE